MFNNHRILAAPRRPPIHSEVVGGGVQKVKVFEKVKEKMGKEKSNKSRIVALRLSPREFSQLDRKFKGSTCRKLSEYIRKVILEKPVVVYYRSASLDESVNELIGLRTELNNIGNNYNQAVKKLHTLGHIAEFKSWIITYEIDRRRLLAQIEEIKKQINKTADQWLQS